MVVGIVMMIAWGYEESSGKRRRERSASWGYDETSAKRRRERSVQSHEGELWYAREYEDSSAWEYEDSRA